jgi:sugar phosphate isomerase/epimerase
MGLIRGTLTIGTLGIISPSSKKQRVNKAIQRNTAATADHTKATVGVLQQQAAMEQARIARDHQFRYDTDSTYQAWCDQQESMRRAVEAAAARRKQLEAEWSRHVVTVRMTQAVTLPLIAMAWILLGVFVWTFQLVLARVQHHQTVLLWKRQAISGATGRQVHLMGSKPLELAQLTA